MNEVSISNWESLDLDNLLRSEVGSRSSVAVRTFQRLTYDDIESGNVTEVDSLEVFRRTGTDRRENASVWNVPNFDHEHDLNPVGKLPNDLIYAFLVDLTSRPCRAAVANGKGGSDWRPIQEITQGLSEWDVMAIYDSSQLERASPNEYWFRTSPIEAALLLIVPNLPEE